MTPSGKNRAARNFKMLKMHFMPRSWSDFRARAGVKAFRAELPGLADDLEAACNEVEPEFIQVGQELQGIYGDARGLTQQVLDIANFIGGKEEKGILSQLRGLAESSLVQLENCQHDVLEKKGSIQSVVTHLHGLLSVCREIEKVGLLLKVVAVNIGVESSRSAASMALFSVVAQDTRNLSEKIRATIEEGTDILNYALSTQQSLTAQFAEGLQEINRLGANAHGIVQEALHGIESLMQGTQRLAETAGDHSKQIHRQVGELVMAIQFHDSMSQRVAHIAEALRDVEGSLGHHPASDNGATDRRYQLARALPIIRLQSEQLKQIIAEIDRVHEAAVCSFEEIQRGFSTLVRHLSEINANRQADEAEGKTAGDPLKRLEVSFEALNGVIRRGRELTDRVHHGASQTSESMDRISHCVGEMYGIGFETHLMALNAIVKAAHLGEEGGAIEVLAREVNQSSDQSRSVLGRASELLEAITHAAIQLRQADGNTHSSETSLDDTIEQIDATYHQLTEATHVAHGTADDISGAVGKTKARLDFLPRLAHRFNESLRQVETMIENLGPFAVGEYAPTQTEAHEILGRYTMEREREIHERSFHGTSVNRVHPAARSESARIHDAQSDKTIGSGIAAPLHDTIELFPDDGQENETADGGIELFAEETSDAPQPSWDNFECFEGGVGSDHVEPGDDSRDQDKPADESWDNVELFDAGPEPGQETGGDEPEAAAHDMKREKESFGDNVELF